MFSVMTAPVHFTVALDLQTDVTTLIYVSLITLRAKLTYVSEDRSAI